MTCYLGNCHSLCARTLYHKAAHLQTHSHARCQETWICKMEHCKDEAREVVTSLQILPLGLFPCPFFHPTCWCNSLISFALLWLSQKHPYPSINQRLYRCIGAFPFHLCFTDCRGNSPHKSQYSIFSQCEIQVISFKVKSFCTVGLFGYSLTCLVRQSPTGIIGFVNVWLESHPLGQVSSMASVPWLSLIQWLF